jgi:hypothetical protein
VSSSEKYHRLIVGTSTPTVSVRPVARLVAEEWATYESSRAARETSALVSSET